LQKTQEVEVVNLESLTSDKLEKDILLDEYDEELKRAKNISFKNLLYVFMAIFFVLALLLPKIYISNEIYYISKNITGMYNKFTALKEEHEHLKRELELLRYKLEVLDELEE